MERSAVCAQATTPHPAPGASYASPGKRAALLLLALSLPLALAAQTAPNPAGTDAPLTLPAHPPEIHRDLSAKQRRDADDAFLKGARALERKDLAEAEASFARAAKLNPYLRDYAIALGVTREHRLTDLVQRAAEATRLGHPDEAHRLLLQAREIDPDNAIVRQHFTPEGALLPPPTLTSDPNPVATGRAESAATLAGPVQLTPTPGAHDFHLHGSARDLVDQVCAAFGLRAEVVTSIDSGPVLRFDLDRADWPQALRALQTLTHTFSVPLQPTQLLFSRDSPENRAQYQPLVEETLFMPGTTQADLTEYANLARNVFNLRVVNAVSNSGSLVLRGDEDTLTRVNATFADLVDGGYDVLLDLTLYEYDRTVTRNIGLVTPSSVGAFSISAEAQSLIRANQSAINTAVANNLIKLTGNTYADQVTEVEFLIATGAVSSSQFTNLLGTLGTYSGAPLLGVFLGSSTTFNLLLNSSDVRILDTVQLRAGDKQDAQFRAGTRYPIETGIYSSGVSGATAASVAGLTINGVSVSSLLAQYAGATSTAVPQIQFEDLGLTLKANPQVLRSGEVTVKLDFKIEALGSGTINTLPILNSRQLTSTVTVPPGKTAILASEVTRSELGALSGIPGLNEIPGFGGTDINKDRSHTEIMITLTPHIVRNKNFQITSRRLLLANGNNANPQ